MPSTCQLENEICLSTRLDITMMNLAWLNTPSFLKHDLIEKEGPDDHVMINSFNIGCVVASSVNVGHNFMSKFTNLCTVNMEYVALCSPPNKQTNRYVHMKLPLCYKGAHICCLMGGETSPTDPLTHTHKLEIFLTLIYSEIVHRDSAHSLH